MSTSHDRLTELFAEAIELAPEAQAVFVARVRASDPALADELGALLDVDAKAASARRRALATGGLAETVDLGPPSKHPPGAPRIAGYRVHDIIGEGGMGTVYAAEQDEPRRRVAIKVLFARSANALVRFKAEAQIMARLDHPGIARVLEAGDADGQPYLVMEHVEGTTLDGFVKKLGRDERLRLFLAICDAVHHAHVKGVIHRDLKPSNVMVRGDRRVVVLDFGVARLASDDGSTPGDTRAGDLVGTPMYMSPEQAGLRPDAVDARSDVYTLGVILYELLSGELPHDLRELPLPAVTRIICDDPIVPLGRHDPALRGDLEAIADKALAKDPADRYQSAAALADDIRRYLDGAPVSVRTPGVLERTRRFIKRRPLVASAIAAAALATATFATVITVLWLDARSARQTAEHARSVAETAREDLERRTNQLVLKQARAVLDRDPTEALAWLGTLTPRATDDDVAGASAILDEALARGVATNVLHGHTDEVHWVEALPGSDAFVTAGYDGRAVVWEPPAFEPRTLVTAKRGRFHAARPSPDGTLIAVGGDQGEAYVVARDGAIVATLSGHVGDVQHLAWAGDGSWLATGDDHGHLRVWSKSAGSRELVVSKVPLGAVAFSDDGSALILGDHAGAVWLWNTRTWQLRTTSAGADLEGVWTDGSRAIGVDASGGIHRWHTDGDGLVAEPVVATKQKIKRVAFARGAAWLALGGVGGAVSRVDGETVTQIGLHRSQVRSLAVSADGRWLADGGDDGTLVLHDLAQGREVELRGHTGRIRHVELTRSALLSSDSEGVVRRWQLESPSPALLHTDRAISRLATDGIHLAAIDADGTVLAWTLADGTRSRLGVQKGRVTELAIVDGTVVTGTAEGDVTWWLPAPVTNNVGGVVTAIATSKGRVAVTSNAGPIRLFTATGAPAGELAGHEGGSDSLAFDTTGTLLASGGQDRTLRLWRRNGDGFVAAASAGGLRGDTHFVEFTPSGDRVLAAGNDGAVVAWPVHDGALGASQVLAQHTGAITAFAIDSRFAVSAGRDNKVIRVPLAGGAATTSVLASSATALVIDAGGDVHATTRASAVERTHGDRATVEVDHGVQAGVALSPERWVLAHEDGTLLVTPLTTRTRAELAAAIASAILSR
ncbi:MAG: protein kinase [Kofleriaceae bacterium]|nr:protein kinase [Kofleriaceae bacterium]